MKDKKFDNLKEKQCNIHIVVCSACGTELTDNECFTNIEMGADESMALCERCWNQTEMYEPQHYTQRSSDMASCVKLKNKIRKHEKH